MKSENNGKIAVAIVAMFVVALSIVGFTYAYFTAQVKGNTADKSVDVVAGKLAITYANGNEILAQNIVPGWISDGDHYYDSKCSSSLDTDEAGNHKITAVKKSDLAAGKCSATDQRDAAVTSPTAADGLTTPVTFTVKNADDNTGDNKYIIRLKSITNGLAAADQTNFVLTLKQGETVVWSGQLAASGDQVIVPSAMTITAGGADQSYSINLAYKNVESAQESKGVGVKATVEVIGVTTNAAGDTVDEDGRTYTFPTANTIDLTA